MLVKKKSSGYGVPRRSEIYVISHHTLLSRRGRALRQSATGPCFLAPKVLGVDFVLFPRQEEPILIFRQQLFNTFGSKR